MSRTARQPAAVDREPPVDPHAIERNYRLERLRRRALGERRAELRRANLRFYVVLAVLLIGTAVIGATIWHQIQQLFGL